MGWNQLGNEARAATRRNQAPAATDAATRLGACLTLRCCHPAVLSVEMGREDV